MEKMVSIVSATAHTIKQDPSRPKLLPVPGQQPICLRCRGAGWMRQDVPYGHPQFGKLVPCICTLERRKAKEQQELVELSGIDDLSRFRSATFENFKRDVPGVGQAFRQAKQFAACPDGWLVMTGPCGCGKTHLSAAIAKERVQAGDTVLLQTVPDLLDRLRSSFAPSVEQSYDERFDQMRDADVLILDDFGAEQSTAWANEKLFQIFNYRYNMSLPTVVTSNNIHLEGIDQRISSRLHDRDLVMLVKMEQAGDYRRRKDEQ